MTCIIGIECEGGNAVIAGDKAGSNGFTYDLNRQPKIFRHSGMLFGYTSTFRFGQILEVLLDDNTLLPPTDPELTYSWLIRQFVPKLKKTLTDNEYTKNSCNAIIVINGQVWELQDDFSVLRSGKGVSSVGSGTYHATAVVMGELHDKTSKPTVDEAKQIIEKAYAITSYCVTSVSNEHDIETFL